jgi:hypothetical protein
MIRRYTQNDRRPQEEEEDDMIRNRFLVLLLTAAFALTPLAGLGEAEAAAGATTARVSVGPAGLQANADSQAPVLSASGRFVAFYSSATNLIGLGNDTNATSDIFVYDRQTQTTERVNVSSSGDQANGESDTPAISASGRFVAYGSWATNLVANDTNVTIDIFVRDRQLGTTERASVNSSAVQGNNFSGSPSISGDGRYVAFDSRSTNLAPGKTTNAYGIFVHDRQTGNTVLASQSSAGVCGNNDAYRPSISGNGQFVAFYSTATNLVPDDSNATVDVFVRDLINNTTGRVSVATDGTQMNGNINADRVSISNDGRYIAFNSSATNLVANDTNAAEDIFVRDRQAGNTKRVSVSSTGQQAGADSANPRLSGNGRYVAFTSLATNLVSGDSNAAADVFIHDMQTGLTGRLSVSGNGTQGNNDSHASAVDADGGLVAFASRSSNLVSGDTNAAWDAFVRDRPSTTLEDVDHRIQYDNWKGTINAGAGGGSFRSTNLAGQNASFSFNGTSVTWVTRLGPGQGKARVLIDNVSKGVFDQYLAGNQWNAQRPFSGLPDGAHTIVVKALGARNPLASNTTVVVDAFIVAGVTTQDASPDVSYGAWQGVRDTDASAGSYYRANSLGAAARLTFTGGTIDWITRKGPDCGKAEVFIDNVDKGPRNLYSATEQWQVAISFGGLSAGTHTIEVRVLGTKNTLSTGTWVALDAFHVTD